MPRLPHGEVVRFDTIEVANAFLAADNPEAAATVMAALQSDLRNFDFLFPDLQNDPGNLLPEPPPSVRPPNPAVFQTRGALVALGRTMLDEKEG